mgnify:CR=1 FL=1
MWTYSFILQPKKPIRTVKQCTTMNTNMKVSEFNFLQTHHKTFVNINVNIDVTLLLTKWEVLFFVLQTIACSNPTIIFNIWSQNNVTLDCKFQIITHGIPNIDIYVSIVDTCYWCCNMTWGTFDLWIHGTINIDDMILLLFYIVLEIL